MEEVREHAAHRKLTAGGIAPTSPARSAVRPSTFLTLTTFSAVPITAGRALMEPVTLRPAGVGGHSSSDPGTFEFHPLAGRRVSTASR